MNILLLGSGGRECTFAWKIAQSPLCEQLYIAPGNGGTDNYGTNVPINPMDFDAVKDFCIQNKIDTLIPGNEDPLVAGIYDFFKADPALQHITVAGPSKDGAILEGSKAFSKAFMERHQIPTAQYAEFTKETIDQGIAYLEQHPLPVVIKADGLAAGKGVIIAEDTPTAISAFRGMLEDASFGKAGDKVVIEEFLTGIELSVFVLSDGKHWVLLPEAKDYKRILEGDQGPNTGGMGAISPVPFADQAFMNKVTERIIQPTIDGLAQEARTYQGFIFFGLINVAGDPMVIEYNCRMGDPETEVVLPRLKNDLLSLIQKMDQQKLDQVRIEHDERVAATVMMVSAGYPAAYEKGKTITNIEPNASSILLHAGTKKEANTLSTNGGRVLAVTSYGANLQAALDNSYSIIEKVQFEGKTFRTDIGYEFIDQ